MKKFARALLVLLALLVIGAIGLWLALPSLNDYPTEGELRLPGLAAPIEVLRDGHGMAYVFAQSLDDALLAQGYVTAQDRLFNMELTRRFAQGTLAEMAGERAFELDIRQRTIGFRRLAERHAALLDDASRHVFQRYVDGVNAYIETGRDSWPLEFRLAGLEPRPWTVADSLSVLYLMAWNSSANLLHEGVSDLLVSTVGEERAATLAPLNLNPDDPPEMGENSVEEPVDDNTDDGASPELVRHRPFPLLDDPRVRSLLDTGPLQMGSNNWAVGAERSPGGKPIVAGDPHLDPRVLPGVWYPMGLVWPENRAVGAAVPGLPGMSIGRTNHLALAVTNAYGDAQDLFIETLDPDDPERYLLDCRQSLPFEIVKETIRIQDDDAPEGFREETVEIRLTRRGPIVSDALPELGEGGRRVSLRWAAAEAMTPRLDLAATFTVRSAAELDASLEHLPMIGLNFVFADVEGHLGWRVSGRLPHRRWTDAGSEDRAPEGRPSAGTRPWPVCVEGPPTEDSTAEASTAADNTAADELALAIEENGADDEALSGAPATGLLWDDDPWIGWIPFEDMPHASDPESGWLGTANHSTVPKDYPYYYSDYASSSYRYRRLKELMAGEASLTVDQHWAWQRDAHNPMAQALAPIFADALSAHDATRDLGEILAAWNHVDDPEEAAPLIFQELVRQVALATFDDELGNAAEVLLDDLYYWQERLQALLVDGDSPWFDDVRTPEVETRDELVRRAATPLRQRLEPLVGADPSAWRWGDLHHLTFVHPLVRTGTLGRWLGSGPHGMGGSAETLYRGWYAFDEPFAITHAASLRMVADLSDDEKIRAILPGGVAGRAFHPHQKDQVEAFVSGEVRHWWFSDGAIRREARSTLRLVP